MAKIENIIKPSGHTDRLLYFGPFQFFASSDTGVLDSNFIENCEIRAPLLSIKYETVFVISDRAETITFQFVQSSFPILFSVVPNCP